MLHYNLLPPSLFFLPQVCFLYSQLINSKDSYVELDRYEDFGDNISEGGRVSVTLNLVTIYRVQLQTNKESLRPLNYRIKVKQGHTLKLFMHKKWF